MPLPIQLRSLAPLLVVDAIEPCLPFWTDRLGFACVATVPDTAPFNFAIVARDGIEVMLQTRASCREDTGEATDNVRASVLYFTVGAIDPVVEALGDTEIAVPRRTTFYGADEIWMRDPAGNLIGFSAHPPAD